MYIISPKEDIGFIDNFLSNKGVDFVIWEDINYAENAKREGIGQNIITNDEDNLKYGTFNAQVFQSADIAIPTRLLIPKIFDKLNGWEKQYSLLHEFGHYLSLNEVRIFDYYAYLEKNKLYGQLYNIPLEIEAERYVFATDKTLFNRNADVVYYNYWEDIKNQGNHINKDSIKTEYFSRVVEIRLFRYFSIIEYVTLKGSKFYKKHMAKVRKNFNRLSNLTGFDKVTGELDPFSKKLEAYLLRNEFDVYCDYCKNIYLKLQKELESKGGLGKEGPKLPNQ